MVRSPSWPFPKTPLAPPAGTVAVGVAVEGVPVVVGVAVAGVPVIMGLDGDVRRDYEGRSTAGAACGARSGAGVAAASAPEEDGGQISYPDGSAAARAARLAAEPLGTVPPATSGSVDRRFEATTATI